MLRDEKIRVVARQWIVPLTAFSARCVPISCGLFGDSQRLAKSGVAVEKLIQQKMVEKTLR
jgi:hypothetical protein